MRIYFCGAIAAGRQNLPVYQYIVRRLTRQGHQVLTEHVADPDVLDRERALTPRRVYERDAEWMGAAEAVVAEVSMPSLGVGYEIACALMSGKPTLCLYRQGLEISKMITGNTSRSLTLAVWEDFPDLDRHIDSFLASVSAVPQACAARSEEACPRP
jgi:hypothetical protein